ncbi:MAG: acylphosphatase [Phycisphaerae bacterium]
MSRKHIVFRGIVQGVGFRATTASIARRHAITGWVRNLADGSVEAELQGDERSISAALAETRRVLAENLDDCDVSECELCADERGFEIRR